MIVPRHACCDICGKDIFDTGRLFTFKSKATYYSLAGGFTERKKHHICQECYGKMYDWINQNIPITEDNKNG